MSASTSTSASSSESASASASMPSLDLPDWFTLTPARIATDSRLKAFFLQPEFVDVDLVAAVADQLPLSISYVENRLGSAAAPFQWPFTDANLVTAFPQYDAPGRARVDVNQKNVAMDATKLLVCAALWRMLPSNNDNFSPQGQAAADGRGAAVIGTARIGSAESLLVSLESSLTKISADVAAASGKGNGRGYILIGNGDYSTTDFDAD